jgi:hypothetical protein
MTSCVSPLNVFFSQDSISENIVSIRHDGPPAHTDGPALSPIPALPVSCLKVVSILGRCGHPLVPCREHLTHRISPFTRSAAPRRCPLLGALGRTLSKTRRQRFCVNAPEIHVAHGASDHTPLGVETPQSRRLRRRTIPDRVRPCGRFIDPELELRQGRQDRRRGACVRLATRGVPGQFHRCVGEAPGDLRRRKL